jgi:hypothetical protein
MWTDDVLAGVRNLIEGKFLKHTDAYLLFKRSEWMQACSNISSLMDFRDFVEDQWTIIVMETGVSLDLGIDSLVKTLKTEPKRAEVCIAFLSSKFRELLKSMTSTNMPRDFLIFTLNEEIEIYLKMVREVGRFRPLFKCSRDTIEKILNLIELKGKLNFQDLKEFMLEMNVPTLWSVLALVMANETGDAEELFLHPPMPRIFGNESSRDLVKKDPLSIVKRSKTSLQFHSTVVAGNGYLGYMTDAMTVQAADRAYLVSPLPGLNHHVWALNPEKREAAIYCLKPFKVVAEFDLPADDDAIPNWIDCQRDAEGTLALLWGHINPLTGCLNTQNMIGLDDDLSNFNISKTVVNLKDHSLGFRVDWRDHSNLLNIHHTVRDDGVSERHFSHDYEICYGSYLLMTLTTDTRPIEAIYGDPHELFLLSPLSASQTLQHWILENGKYNIKKSSGLIKPPKGHWTSLCVLSE